MPCSRTSTTCTNVTRGRLGRRSGPNAKVGFEGPDSGEVASMNWVGNDEVGAGKMTITESKPNDLVNFRINFTEPFVGTSTSSFT